MATVEEYGGRWYCFIRSLHFNQPTFEASGRQRRARKKDAWMGLTGHHKGHGGDEQVLGEHCKFLIMGGGKGSKYSGYMAKDNGAAKHTREHALLAFGRSN